MTFRFALAVTAALAPALLGACSKTPDSTTNQTIPTAPVAAKAAPAGTTWVDTVVKTPEGGYRMGNPDAPVKLIEFGSRSCPHCAAFDAEGLPAMKAGPIAAGKLSYEFRDYPVHAVLDFGPILLGQCVAPAQFFPMLDQMMQNQQTLLNKPEIPAVEQAKLQQMSPSQTATYLANYYGYVDFVKQRGVPEAKAQACLSDPKAIEAIATQTDAATRQYNVTGTPTFVLNGKVVPNTADWAALQPALKSAGAL